jgi:hypothetical protein
MSDTERTQEQTALLWLSDASYKRAEGLLRSASGADQVDSELHLEESRLYQATFRGADLEAALATSIDRFRAYAAEWAARIAAAAKLKSGPRSGQSVIEHRYVDPEGFARRAPEIRRKVTLALTDPVTVTARRGYV